MLEVKLFLIYQFFTFNNNYITAIAHAQNIICTRLFEVDEPIKIRDGDELNENRNKVNLHFKVPQKNVNI